MNINIRTEREIGQYIVGTLSVNTDDYPDLDGKTIEEIKLIDNETLFNLKTNKGECLKNTISFERSDEEGWSGETNYDLDGDELENELESSECVSIYKEMKSL